MLMMVGGKRGDFLRHDLGTRVDGKDESEEDDIWPTFAVCSRHYELLQNI